MSLTRLTRLPYRTAARRFSGFLPRMSDQDKSALDHQGSVGKEFRLDGSIGGKAERVGGPFSSDGAVGKEFTKDGSIGGTAQQVAEAKPVFDKEGAIGKQFQADGNIGQVGEAVGGPFSKEGAVGKQFTDGGSIGGTVQKNLGRG